VSEYKENAIRNVALISHSDSGKSSLAEAMLCTAKVISRLGRIEDGSTMSDYNADEIERKHSISSTLLNYNWNNTKINILDTPGSPDFIGEVVGILPVVDLGIMVINVVSGIEVGTEIVWRIAEEKQLPRIIVINKLDKENTDFDQCIGELQSRFGKKVVLAQFPVNPGPQFDQIIDIVHMQKVQFSDPLTKSDIPAEHQERAKELREQLMENAAESNDTLIEKYLDNGELSQDDFIIGLKSGTIRGSIIPVYCASAYNNIGTHLIMDALVNLAPSPFNKGVIEGKEPEENTVIKRKGTTDEPVSLFIFKTISEPHVGELSFFKVNSGILKTGQELLNPNRDKMERLGQFYHTNGKERREIGMVNAGDLGAAVKLKNTHTGDTLCEESSKIIFPEIDFPSPVIRIAVEPKSRGDEERINNGLQLLHEEDPSFIFSYDNELKQTIVSGQGELHLDIIINRLKRKFNVEVNLVQPKIPYRETIKGFGDQQGKYKRQSGGRGQYGDTWLKIEPKGRGEGFEFVNAIVGGVIPSKYIPAVQKGIEEAMSEGVLAGYPVVDLKATLYDGSYHSVDSSDMAFKIAGSIGFKKAFMDADPILLEPIYDLEVTIPEEYMGDVMGDISSRRGKILGMDTQGSFQLIKAKVPLAELYRYSTHLRSLTSGRGIHKRKFSHYEEVPFDVSQKIIKSAKEEKK